MKAQGPALGFHGSILIALKGRDGRPFALSGLFVVLF
jgi:hypothetical protein